MLSLVDQRRWKYQCVSNQGRTFSLQAALRQNREVRNGENR